MYACMQIIPTRIRVFWYADYTYDVRRLLYAKYPFVREFWYAELVRRLYLQRTRVRMYADYIYPGFYPNPVSVFTEGFRKLPKTTERYQKLGLGLAG